MEEWWCFLGVLREVAGMGMPVAAVVLAGGERPVPGVLAQWAEGLGRSQARS
jgi:hypothetical protein